MLAIEEKIKNMPDNTGLIQQLKESIDRLREDVITSRFPEGKVDDFSKRLDIGITLLKQPSQNKVLHQHHVPILIWATIGLFVVFALVCAGWLNTSNKLESYIANDTKYRYLRLNAGYIKMQIYLDKTGSLYNALPDLRKSVIETEKQYRQNFERLRKAERLKAEANILENAVKRK